MTTEDQKLDADFAAMRQGDMAPSENLFNRIMMDADDVLAGNAAVAARAKQGIGTLLLDAIGGWPSFAGLATATVAGLWIGVAPPAALADLSAGYLGSTVEIPLLENDIFTGLDG